MLVLPQVAGVTPPAGVKAGDWAHYVVTQKVTGNAALVKSFVDQYSAYANTSYVSLNVTQVVGGSNVSLTLDIHHTNGTIARSNQTVDVSLGVTNDNPPLVIMQNMTALTYLSNGNFSYVPRTINNLDVDSPPGGNSSALRYSWDEFTGILLSEQFVYDMANATSTGTFTFTLVMTATNLWHYVPPKPTLNSPTPVRPSGLQFLELYALAGVIGSLTVGVVAYTLKRSPKTKGPSRISARDSRRTGRELNRQKKTTNE